MATSTVPGFFYITLHLPSNQWPHGYLQLEEKRFRLLAESRCNLFSATILGNTDASVTR